MEQNGRSLHELATAIEQERAGFLDWLGTVCGVRIRDLRGWTRLEGYAIGGRDVVLDVLDSNSSRLSVDPRARARREQIVDETEASAARLAESRGELERIEREVDDLLGEAYRLTSAQRHLVDAESGA